MKNTKMKGHYAMNLRDNCRVNLFVVRINKILSAYPRHLELRELKRLTIKHM